MSTSRMPPDEKLCARCQKAVGVVRIAAVVPAGNRFHGQQLVANLPVGKMVCRNCQDAITNEFFGALKKALRQALETIPSEDEQKALSQVPAPGPPEDEQ